jgi:hypothetical protein
MIGPMICLDSFASFWFVWSRELPFYGFIALLKHFVISKAARRLLLDVVAELANALRPTRSKTSAEPCKPPPTRRTNGSVLGKHFRERICELATQ